MFLGVNYEDDIDWASLAAEFGVIGGALALHFYVCLLGVRRWCPKHSDLWSLADIVAASSRNYLLVLLVLHAVVKLRHTVESRWQGVTCTSRLFGLVYVSWNFLHVGVLLLQKQCMSQRAIMIMHHALSIPCYLYALLSGKMHYWGCLAGCCEATNIFLNTLYLFKEVTIKDRPLQEYVPKWMYLVNGACLWLSFLVFRMILFPYWLYAWFADVRAWREATWDSVSVFERCMYPTVTTFMLALSTQWFVRISAGLFRALTNSGSSGPNGQNGHHKHNGLNGTKEERKTD